mmetsp:Transcript_12504/g.30364  ORF Transcript_12504/g.30364 Transcript_12504/m.30364 type:complete len:240 (-) Transcript_12504:4994-5713(-)
MAVRICRRPPAAHQHKVPGALPHEERRSLQPEPPEPARDQVATVRAKDLVRGETRRDLEGPLRKMHHGFASHAARGHEPEGVDDAIAREVVHFHGHEVAGFHRGDHRERERAVDGRVQADPVQVNRGERDAFVERQHVKRRRPSDVLLPELHEAPPGAQQLEALVQRFAGQGVEDDVHTLALRVPADVIREVESARVVHMQNPSVRELLPLLRSARRRVHLRADHLGNLDRCLPHPPRG